MLKSWSRCWREQTFQRVRKNEPFNFRFWKVLFPPTLKTSLPGASLWLWCFTFVPVCNNRWCRERIVMGLGLFCPRKTVRTHASSTLLILSLLSCPGKYIWAFSTERFHVMWFSQKIRVFTPHMCGDLWWCSFQNIRIPVYLGLYLCEERHLLAHFETSMPFVKYTHTSWI